MIAKFCPFGCEALDGLRYFTDDELYDHLRAFHVERGDSLVGVVVDLVRPVRIARRDYERGLSR